MVLHAMGSARKQGRRNSASTAGGQEEESSSDRRALWAPKSTEDACPVASVWGYYWELLLTPGAGEGEAPFLYADRDICAALCVSQVAGVTFAGHLKAIIIRA